MRTASFHTHGVVVSTTPAQLSGPARTARCAACTQMASVACATVRSASPVGGGRSPQAISQAIEAVVWCTPPHQPQDRDDSASTSRASRSAMIVS